MAGLIAGETADTITLRRADGTFETVPRTAIEQVRATGKSLMPDGLEEKMNAQQLADVIEFLRRPDRALLE